MVFIGLPFSVIVAIKFSFVDHFDALHVDTEQEETVRENSLSL
jgi:hypothetical protein